MNHAKTIAEYTTFFEEHDGARPRLHVPGERDLALRVADLGWCHDNGRTDEATDRLILDAPDWADTDHDRRWWETLREYQLWMGEHDNRHPRMNGVGTDPHERRLGVWAALQRRVLRACAIPGRDSERRAAVLRERIPGLLDNGWAAWQRRLDDYLAHLRRNGQPPSAKAEDPEEAKAGKWLLRQIDEYQLDRLSGDRIDALDLAVPGWNDRCDVSWDGRLARYERFVAGNGGCAPRDGTGNKFEQFLYEWDLAQRTAFSDGHLDHDRAARFLSVNPRRARSGSCRHKNKPRRR